MKYIETEKVELKRILNNSFEKEVVAFLNSHDGIIYIGIENDGTIIGVNNVDKLMKEISDIITDKILPDCKNYVHPSAIYEDGRMIIKVEVNKGKSLYYIKKYGRSSSGCYIRIGTTCKSMSEEEIEKGYINSIIIPEKSIKDISVLRDDYTFFKLKQYLVNKGIHINDETFLKNFNLKTEDGKYNILADILADENMNSIKVAVFKGIDKSTFFKRNEYGYTCLIESLEKVINYCDALNETFIDVSVRPRKEYKLFNTEAFKEAWINACVHNKWSEGLSPAVYWFDDRLEIVSYGGIPENLTKMEFLQGKTEPVNKDLMNIFLQCGIVEHSGHGVPIVVKEYGENSYSFSKNMIKVTIPFNKNKTGTETTQENEKTTQENEKTTQENEKTTQESSKTGTETTQEKILNLIKKNKNITRKSLADIIGITPNGIKYHLDQMKKQGIIKHIGSTKSGYWEIKK